MKKLLTIMFAAILLTSTFCVPAQAKGSKWPKGPAKSSITAESAVVMELNTGTILYNKNMHDKHYPASITKILTTLLCLENAGLDETVTFSSRAVNSIEYGSSNISIVANEQIKMEDCLYGIMLMSANEACNGVAEHIGGSIEGFVDMMNEKAKSLGCKDTHFANPNGLYLENHYTSAYDMGLIATAAMKNPMFRKITGTKTYTIPKTNLKDERHLYNKHNMLYPITYPRYGYEYCIGGKTGYTDIARWTLVTFAKKGDLELVSVVMKTAGPPRVEPNEYTDTIKLMNYAIENYEKHPLNVDITSQNEEGQYSLFTKYNKIFDTENSPLYVKDNAGVVLPKGVDISEAKKNIEYYDQNVQTSEGTAIGRITYTYDGKEAGVADILYDASRMGESNLNGNVSKIISSVSNSNDEHGNETENGNTDNANTDNANTDNANTDNANTDNANNEIADNDEQNNNITNNVAVDVTGNEQEAANDDSNSEKAEKSDEKNSDSGSFIDMIKSNWLIITIAAVVIIVLVVVIILLLRARSGRRSYLKYYGSDKNWFKRY